MSDDKVRIAELERQLMDLRKSAVSTVVGMAEGMAQSSQDRAELAQKFEDAAQHETGGAQRLAQMVAAALRAVFVPDEARKVT